MTPTASDDPGVRARAAFYRTRAPEELYDLAADPDCRRTLGAWLTSTADPLATAHAGTVARVQ